MFNHGDIVKYKGEFLRSVGWYTNVPKDGKVIINDQNPIMGDPSEKFCCVAVHWCDSPAPKLCNIKNIMLASKPG